MGDWINLKDKSPHHGQRCLVKGVEKQEFDVIFIGSYPMFGFMTEDSELPNILKKCIVYSDIDQWKPFLNEPL